jgi:hypothetical protein
LLLLLLVFLSFLDVITSPRSFVLAEEKKTTGSGFLRNHEREEEKRFFF